MNFKLGKLIIAAPLGEYTKLYKSNSRRILLHRFGKLYVANERDKQLLTGSGLFFFICNID